MMPIYTSNLSNNIYSLSTGKVPKVLSRYEYFFYLLKYSNDFSHYSEKV